MHVHTTIDVGRLHNKFFLPERKHFVPYVLLLEAVLFRSGAAMTVRGHNWLLERDLRPSELPEG